MTQHLFRYDNTNINWQSDPRATELFLKGVRNHVTRLLEIRGHVFLNDVMDKINMSRVAQGQLEGWILPDGYVDFEWSANSDGSFELYFNTSGVIYDKI